MFKAGAAGNLVLSERARLNIEKLHALSTPEELQRKLQTIGATLPPTAHRRLLELVDRYQDYTATMR